MFYIIYQFIIQLKPKTYKQEFDRLISGAKKREKLLLKKNFRRKKAFRPHLQDLQVLNAKRQMLTKHRHGMGRINYVSKNYCHC